MHAAAGLAFVLAGPLAAGDAPFAANAVLSERALAKGSLIRVGHEAIAPDPTVRRYTGKVVALGSPDESGKSYTFKVAPVGPRNFPLTTDDLRAWRLTILSGKRFGEVFRVQGNTEAEVTVKREGDSIDGVAINDVFVIESIDENGASMFAPATNNNGSPGPGV